MAKTHQQQQHQLCSERVEKSNRKQRKIKSDQQLYTKRTDVNNKRNIRKTKNEKPK